MGLFKTIYRFRKVGIVNDPFNNGINDADLEMAGGLVTIHTAKSEFKLEFDDGSGFSGIIRGFLPSDRKDVAYKIEYEGDDGVLYYIKVYNDRRNKYIMIERPEMESCFTILKVDKL